MEVNVGSTVRKLYNLQTPIQLQVVYVGWHSKQCFIRLADETSLTTVILLSKVLEEVTVGDNIVIKKLRWNDKSDDKLMETCQLMDKEFCYLIITKYYAAARECENVRIFGGPFTYLQSIQKMKGSLKGRGQKIGDSSVLGGCITACIDSAEKNLLEGTALRQKGNKKFEIKDYKEAIKYYEEAKCFLKYDSTIWSNSSLAYQRIGENDQSLTDALIALKLDPYSVKPYHRACSAMKNLKQLDMGLRFLRGGMFLLGSCNDFSSIFEAFRSEIAELSNTTELLEANLSTTLHAIAEQATLECRYIRKNIYNVPDSNEPIGVDMKDVPNPAKSLTELLTEVKGAKSMQQMIKDANTSFVRGAYGEALLKYTEVGGSKSPSICRAEMCVLKFLCALCNVMLVHPGTFDDDFRLTWFTRLLQEWLFIHCIANGRVMKNNCRQCVICSFSNQLTNNKFVEIFIGIVPSQYLEEVYLYKEEPSVEYPPIRKNSVQYSTCNQPLNKEFEMREMWAKLDRTYSLTAASYDAGGSATENSNPTSEGTASRATNRRPNAAETSKGKNKNKQNNKKKVPPVKKTKNNTKGKKNKKKNKKTNSAQAKQGISKRRNDDDSDKDSDSDSQSSSEMADDENEVENDECDMLNEDDISLGYNPRREGEANGSLADDNNSSISDSQMEILYEFMADWLNERGPMKNDEPRLIKYMAECFPQNALSYVKNRSVEDFLVKSGRFVAADSFISVKSMSDKGKALAAAPIFNAFKNSSKKFFISDHCKTKKIRKNPKYLDFVEARKVIEEPQPIPTNNVIRKKNINGDAAKKSKSSAMDLDDFEDDFNAVAIPPENKTSVWNNIPRTSTAETLVQRNKSPAPISTTFFNKDTSTIPINIPFLSDSLRDILNPPLDTNTTNNIPTDTNNSMLATEIEELKEKLLKSQEDLKGKTREVFDTRKEYNELYKKTTSVTEDYDKFKLHQRFEMRQLEEDRADLQKQIENEKGSYGAVRSANEETIESLRKQVDVLTFKLGRCTNEINDKDKLVEQGTSIQTELMKRLIQADTAYLSLKSEAYETICKRELNRLNSELKVLRSLPACALDGNIVKDALGLWQQVQHHIKTMLHNEKKKILLSYDNISCEKIKQMDYDGLRSLNIPDAHLALLFEQQSGMVNPTHVATPTHVNTPTLDTASTARSPFTESGRSFASASSPFSSATTVQAPALKTSAISRGAFSFGTSSAAPRLPVYGEQTFTQQGTGIRDGMKEIWQTKQLSTGSPSSIPYSVPSELPGAIIRPVPQMGAYLPTKPGLFGHSSPLEPTSDAHSQLIDGYVQKYGSSHSQEELSKAVEKLRKKYYVGQLTTMPLDTLCAHLHEILLATRNPWSGGGSQMGDSWTTNDNLCPICLGSLSDGGQKVDLPCDHNFHKSCLMAWTKKNSTCPTCRKVIAVNF